jgi:hypothetical protein
MNPGSHVEKGPEFRFALKMQTKKMLQKDRKRMTKMLSEAKLLKGHFFTGRELTFLVFIKNGANLAHFLRQMPMM